jgi:hypothetical protein
MYQGDRKPKNGRKLKVFDRNHNYLGNCAVLANEIEGSKFSVPLAEESRVCKSCGHKHTKFRTIPYDLYIFGAAELGLITREKKDVEYLPGFTSATAA